MRADRFLSVLGPRSAVLAALVFTVGAESCGPSSAPNDVLVFAAASLKNVLDELAEPIRRATGVVIRPSYAASSALARQIEEGAPADVFISADVEWMDYLALRKLIQNDSRVPVAGNRLVLVAPASAPVKLTIAPGFALAAALGDGRLAVGDPATVPAGKYARAALTSLGVWDSVAGRLAPAENVRAALRLVARGEAPLGIVYRTDASIESGVSIVDTFADDTHPPIVYPAALTTGASDRATRVLAFLQTADARAAFARHGFTAVTPARK